MAGQKYQDLADLLLHNERAKHFYKISRHHKDCIMQQQQLHLLHGRPEKFFKYRGTEKEISFPYKTITPWNDSFLSFHGVSLFF